MSKKVVMGIVAGVGITGVIAGIVHRNNKKVRQAYRLVGEATDLVERSMDVVDEAIELLRADRDYDDYDFLDEDYYDDDYYEEGDEDFDD